MQISILSNDLLNVLKKLEILTKSKIGVEIIHFIHISAQDELRVSATNLELFAAYTATAKIHVPGEVVADPSSLIKFVDTLDKKKNYRVDIELIKGTPATYEMKPCPRCEGTGEAQCETCHGTGQRHRIYSGQGTYDCDRCNHTGKRPCSFVSNYPSETCVKGQVKKQVDPGVPDKLIVSCGAKKIEIKVLPVEDYLAVFSMPENVEWLNLPTDALFPELERVKVGCATEDNRPILTGMLWQTEWNEEVSDTASLCLAGCDGFRLHMARVGIVPQYKLSAIMPGNTVAYLLKHCKDDEISICINPTDQHQMYIVWKDSMLVTQLIDGKFPDYKSIVPKTHDTYFLANSADVLDALKTASIYSNKGNGTIDIKTVPNGFACQGLAISATSQGEGKVEQEIPIENCSNNAVNEFAFNQKYITEAAKTLPGKITFYMNGATAPALLQGEYDTFQVVIMPTSKSR